LSEVFRLPRIKSRSTTDEYPGDGIVQIDIQARGFSLTEGLRTHAERRVRFALGSTSSRVRSIVMRLADENGPRGGVDKRCTIRAHLPGAPPVIIEQHEADLYVAIDRAADRAGRAVSRRLDRASGGRRDASSAGNAALVTD
jgi:putative sigma-54 modulation protein